MLRGPARIALIAALLTLGGSSQYNLADPIVAHSIKIRAEPLRNPQFYSSSRLRFVEGWTLHARDRDFGGLSGLLVVPGGLLAIGDAGALVTLRFRGAAPARADIAPLPPGCGQGPTKLQRDTESLAREDAGRIWISFEWRNAVCRVTPDLLRATSYARPRQMRPWPYTGGPEAMTRLHDGKIAVLAERGRGNTASSPLLLFSDDPAVPGAEGKELIYRSPAGYRPTDIAELADGALLVLHRRFGLPFNFSSMLSVIPAGSLATGALVNSRALALFKAPGLHDNFEGLAVEDRDGKSYIWIISDDNFAPMQRTYLIKLELLPPKRR